VELYLYSPNALSWHDVHLKSQGQLYLFLTLPCYLPITVATQSLHLILDTPFYGICNMPNHWSTKDVTGDRMKLRNEELYNVYPSPYIARIRNIKSKMRWARHVARVG